MNDSDAARTAAEGRIGKQIVLPWSKAIEIAAKSIRVRFWRSMITMSSIILAIAFLMAIWTSTSITAALAVGPQQDIDQVKKQAGLVRATQEGAPEALSPDDLKSRLRRELRRALAWNADEIRALQDAREDAVSDEAKKLDEQIAELEAKAEPASQVELLGDYLKWRRGELERTKGKLDTTLQQERVTGETEGEAGEQTPPARAALGGSFIDFIRHMSATDTWLAILAMLVCFVGIMNAMFMTVQERFREIGTMKCLGALDTFIVKLFLLESSALGLIGTLLGIVVGLLLSTVRQLFVYGWPTMTYFPKGNIILAAASAAVFGLALSIAAAIAPAQKAARMEPVEAMRVEE